MTNLRKLAPSLGCRWVAAVLVLIPACSAGDAQRLVGPPGGTAAAGLVRVSVVPRSAQLMLGDSLALVTWGHYGNGDSIIVPAVSYSATGGTITTGGLYIAGMTPGTYRAVATQQGGTEADTSVLTVTAPPLTPTFSNPAELPRVYLDTRYPAPTGRAISVPAGADLQAAIDQAQPGDVLLLQAGATFMGNFSLPRKGTGAWITIRTSAADGSLPAEGQRITPAYSSAMARVVSPNNDPAIHTAPGVGAAFYRLTGLEITFAPQVGWSYGLVRFGDGYGAETSLDQVPHDLVIDRSYVHGYAGLPLKRCVELNSARTAIVDSYLSECHGSVEDTQAIMGWNGPGPFKIVDNYLEGATENLMFGGDDPTISGLVPSDIEIRQNHLYKDPAWRGVWSIKNLFELKNAQRVLVEGNVLEGNWTDPTAPGGAQNGSAFMLFSANQGGGCPWCVVQDVTIRYNKIVNSGSGITVSASPGATPAVHARRITFYYNVFDRINVTGYDGGALAVQTGGDLADLVVEHNTFIVTASQSPLFFSNYGPLSRFRFANNIAVRGLSGVVGEDPPGTMRPEGSGSLAWFAAGYVFAGNVVIAAQASLYPPGNYFPATIDAVGFVDPASSDWRLGAGSPLKGHATDGTDPGADIVAVEAATRGAVVP